MQVGDDAGALTMALFNNIHSHKINMNIGARYRILIFLIKLVFKGLVFINLRIVNYL